MRTLAALSGAALLAMANTAAANLLADPGFEADAVSPGTYNYIGGGQTLGSGAWQVTGADIGLIQNSYSEGSGPPLVFNAHSGANSVDLTGVGNTGRADGVFQDVATTAGLTYDLSFYVGNANTAGTYAMYYEDPATVDLSINGGPRVSFVNSDITQNEVNWKLFNTSFIASGAITRIAFLNGNAPTDNFDGIDDISLVANSVPEPASWALMIAGVGLTGASLRRRARPCLAA